MFDSISLDFDKGIFKEGKLVIVVFFASYCPFCSEFSDIFQEQTRNTEYVIAKADITDDNNPFWEIYDIKAVPTIIAFKDEKEIERKDSILGVGLNKKDLETFLKNLQTLGH
jgi:thiol-disulfide isomerase/thioredoxin